MEFMRDLAMAATYPCGPQQATTWPALGHVRSKMHRQHSKFRGEEQGLASNVLLQAVRLASPHGMAAHSSGCLASLATFATPQT